MWYWTWNDTGFSLALFPRYSLLVASILLIDNHNTLILTSLPFSWIIKLTNFYYFLKNFSYNRGNVEFEAIYVYFWWGSVDGKRHRKIRKTVKLTISRDSLSLLITKMKLLSCLVHLQCFFCNLLKFQYLFHWSERSKWNKKLVLVLIFE